MREKGLLSFSLIFRFSPQGCRGEYFKDYLFCYP
jgi:hypothetical protein